MILRLAGKFGRDEYVVCPSAPATVLGVRERMINRAKVIEGSYAHRLIDELHSAIFLQSLDLKADYELYFAREYPNIAEFLRRRTGFPAAVITKLADAVDAISGMYHFCPYHAFLTDSDGVAFLARLIDDLPSEEET